jgi:anaerobic nitric oxide reductase flavorubredoxin
MQAIKIANGIFWVGANVTTNDLFEGIWPIPYGVSLNCYVVQGEKTAMIDLVRDWQGAPLYLLEQLQSINLHPSKVDYIILNHLEPDHTGWTGIMREINPNVQIITTAKGAELVKALFRITENIRIVKSGDTLDLGNGKFLMFEEIPNVHWPETMVTYEKSTQTLFSCDAFGSFGMMRGSIFDDEIPPETQEFYKDETLRYYANIVAPFSSFVLKAIEKLAGIPIKTVCPSHGLVWRGNPKKIINQYKTLANYMTTPAEPEITVIYGSMYGNTEHLLRSVLAGIASEGVTVSIFKIPEANQSFILSKAWKSAGLVIGMPTYEYKMFPPMTNIIDILERKHVWNKKVLRFGSFGWSGGAQKEFDEKTKNMKWECIEPVEFRGAPTNEDMATGFNQGKKLAQMIKTIPKKWID